MFDVIVIGGGASGLAAAITASKNQKVLLIEKNNTCGKKILITGNGKCNYWNESQDINHYHTTNKKDLFSIITEDNENKVMNFFDNIGIIPKTKNGYYYPYSNQAASVQTSLIKEMQNNNVKLVTEEVISVAKENGMFIVNTNINKYMAKKVIIATGSKAYPKTGSTGDGYKFALDFGHKVIKPLPGLVQVETVNNLKECSGVRCDGLITLLEQDKYRSQEYGEIQFTDYGLSGICIMQLSSYISRGLDNNKTEKFNINFLPNLVTNIDDALNFFDHRNNKLEKRNISELLDGLLNYKLVNYLLKISKIDKMKSWNDLSNESKIILAKNIVELEIEVSGTKGFDNAQICTGGIDLSEINLETFESKLVHGLYFTGEILDVNGDCGGYNLGFAWISGIVAGEACRGLND